MLRRLSTTTIGELKELRDGVEVILGGMIASVKPARTRRGDPMAHFEIETIENDAQAICRAVIFKPYVQYRDLIKKDAVVFVRGTVDLRMDTPSIQVVEVIPLKEAQRRLTEKVRIKLECEGLAEQTLQDLCDVLKAHSGRCPVFFEMLMTNQKRVLIQAGGHLCVQASDQFAQDVQEVVGPERLVFLGRNGNGGRK